MIPASPPRLLHIAALCALIVAAAAPANAQRSKKPEKCTVCLHDPELMEANGITHGPFKFARTDTDNIQLDFFYYPKWIETKHFRIGAELDSWKIPENERKAYRAELTELRKKWPKINPRKAVMDPWLRAHLVADRMERLYSEFQELVGRTEESFWDEERNTRWGMGPYLGEHDKYEIMIFQGRGPYGEFMSVTWGLTYLKPQRWNNADRSNLWFGLNLEEDEIRHDQHLHNYLRHNLAHNLIDGYEYFGYELPVWITEGFAHWIERKNDTRYNMFDSVEGAFTELRSLDKWEPTVRKIALKGDAASFSQLLRRKSFAEIDFYDHLIVWSKIDFLIRHEPGKFAEFVNALCGRRNEKGTPDGSNLDTAQRDAFKSVFGWTLHQAEEAWVLWVKKNYPTK